MAESHSNETWKEIPLTQGQVAIVDTESFQRISEFKWYAVKDRRRESFYARRCIKIEGHRKALPMPNFVLGIASGIKVDHINHDTLDNRRCNLRACTNSQNAANRRIQTNNTSGFTGISWDKKLRKWRAYLIKHQKRQYLGFFSDLNDAVQARRRAAIDAFGEFSNEP